MLVTSTSNRGNCTLSDRSNQTNSSSSTPTFFIFPYFVLQDRSLDLLNKNIYAYFWSFHTAGRNIFVSNSSLAELFGVKERCIRDRISQLEKMGYIERELTNNRRFIHVKKLGAGRVETPPEKTDSGTANPPKKANSVDNSNWYAEMPPEKTDSGTKTPPEKTNLGAVVPPEKANSVDNSGKLVKGGGITVPGGRHGGAGGGGMAVPPYNKGYNKLEINKGFATQLNDKKTQEETLPDEVDAYTEAVLNVARDGKPSRWSHKVIKEACRRCGFSQLALGPENVAKAKFLDAYKKVCFDYRDGKYIREIIEPSPSTVSESSKRKINPKYQSIIDARDKGKGK